MLHTTLFTIWLWFIQLPVHMRFNNFTFKHHFRFVTGSKQEFCVYIPLGPCGTHSIFPVFIAKCTSYNMAEVCKQKSKFSEQHSRVNRQTFPWATTASAYACHPRPTDHSPIYISSPLASCTSAAYMWPYNTWRPNWWDPRNRRRSSARPRSATCPTSTACANLKINGTLKTQFYEYCL